MAAAKKSEWFVGAEHEELLEATRQQRHQRDKLKEAQRSGGGGSRGHGGQAGGAGQHNKHTLSVNEAASRVKEILEDNFDDVYDAFTELDGGGNGRLSKNELKDGVRGLGATEAMIPEMAISDLFDAIDVDNAAYITLRDFLIAFAPQDLKGKKGGSAGGMFGKGTAQATQGGGLGHKPAEDREAHVKRDFQEVLIECKDESGVQKFVAVPAIVSFNELLQRLKAKYGRHVTIAYEGEGGAQYTVKNAKDLRRCFDIVEAAYLRAGVASKSAQLECLVVDFDPRRQEASGAGAGGRPGLAPPLKTKKSGEKESAMSKLRRGAVTRDPLSSIDFGGKHRWIDDMLKALGAPTEGEPAAMQGKWQKLLDECHAIDQNLGGAVTPEGFRNALTRTEPRMNMDQVEWFLKEADRSETGDVMYEKYIKAKKSGGMGDGGGAQDSQVDAAERKILYALRSSFSSLQQAFRRMDSDRDGRLSKEEFRKGIETRLKLKLAPKLTEAVISRADVDGDGFVDYEDFLASFRDKGDENKGEALADGMPDVEICRVVLDKHQGNVGAAFEEMDTDKDGRLSADELRTGLKKSGVNISQMRVEKLMEAMDEDNNRFVDYREFLKFFSRVDITTLSRSKFDRIGLEVAAVCERLREKFDDAKQAFHAFDKDSDGRLGWDEFEKGVGSFSSAGPDVIRGMFERSDRSGDGYVAYHEFLLTFQVKPKSGLSSGADAKVRDFLRGHFPDGNITAAFTRLDLDGDSRLSGDDLRDGLASMGLHLDQGEVDALIRRGDFDGDSHIDYLEFLVRFGLQQRAEGKWEYKAVDNSAGVQDAEAAKPIRKGVLPSRWHGRGGVAATLLRFDADKDGKLKKDELERALRDGLGASDLTSDDVDAIVPARFDKVPYWDSKKGLLDVSKFVSGFVEVNCRRELAFYSVLLVRNEWMSVLASLDATPGGRGGYVSKADFSGAFQKLVDSGVCTEAERALIIAKVVEDGRFASSGPNVGMIDYYNGFFMHYIGEEVAVHQVVSPVWEDWARSLDKWGGTVTHAQFRDIVRSFATESPLTDYQVESLIDVIDADGDGSVSRTELVRRYARGDAELMLAVRSHWLGLYQLLDRSRRPGTPDSSRMLIKGDMQHALVKACETGLLGSITVDQVPRIIASIDKALVTDSGEVRYEEWIQRYAGGFFAVHKALQGKDARTGLPKWDSVIACFEMLDAVKGPSSQAAMMHEVSWDHFRKALASAKVELSNDQVRRVIDHLDKGMTGTVNWHSFVNGGPEGQPPRGAPYFFNGDLDLKMRTLLRVHWDDALSACRDAEKAARKADPALFPASSRGALPPKFLGDALTACAVLKLGGDAGKPSDLVKRILEVSTAAFGHRDGVKLVDSKGGAMIDYVAMARYYAGAMFHAEELFERRWEGAVAAIEQMTASGGSTVPRVDLEARLRRPDLGLTDEMVGFLLKGQASGPEAQVDYREMCWRCSRTTIHRALSAKWATLMRCWRGLDKTGSNRLASDAFRGGLDRPEVGLSKRQVDMLMMHIDPEEDGRVDYNKVLSGRLRGSTYNADAYLGWKSLEASWDDMSDSFEQLDANADGSVSHHEFRSAVLQLRVPGLQDSTVIDAVLKELDPANKGEVVFDDVTWAMSKQRLRDTVGECAQDVLSAFRSAAAAAFSKGGGGTLTAPEAEKVIDSAVAKRHFIKPVYAKLIAVRASAGGRVAEGGLSKILGELSGAVSGGSDAERLRSELEGLMLVGYGAGETWVEKGVERQAARSEFGGVCVLGKEAMSCVGSCPVRRGHMKSFLGDGGKALWGQMAPTEAMEKIRRYRVDKVYGSAPWKAFWQVRNTYKSGPPFSTLSGPLPAGGGRGFTYAPRKHARSDGKASGQPPAVKVPSVLEKAESAIRKAIADRGARIGEAPLDWEVLDPERRGVAAVDAIRAWILTIGAKGVGEEEVEAVLKAVDPVGDGIVLCRVLSSRYDPPAADLAKLFEARRSLGVYERLRDRAPHPSHPSHPQHQGQPAQASAATRQGGSLQQPHQNHAPAQSVYAPAASTAWGPPTGLGWADENVPPQPSWAGLVGSNEQQSWPAGSWGGGSIIQQQLGVGSGGQLAPNQGGAGVESGLGAMYAQTVEQLQLLADLRGRSASSA